MTGTNVSLGAMTTRRQQRRQQRRHDQRERDARAGAIITSGGAGNAATPADERRGLAGLERRQVTTQAITANGGAGGAGGGGTGGDAST